MYRGGPSVRAGDGEPDLAEKHIPDRRVKTKNIKIK